MKIDFHITLSWDKAKNFSDYGLKNNKREWMEVGKGWRQEGRKMERQRTVYNPYIDGTAAEMLQSSLVVWHAHLLRKLMNGLPVLAEKEDLLGRNTTWLDLSCDKKLGQVWLTISTAHWMPVAVAVYQTR